MSLSTRSGPKVVVLAAGFMYVFCPNIPFRSSNNCRRFRPDVSAAAFVARELRDRGIAIVGVSMDTDTYLEANSLSQVVSTQEFLHVSDPYLGDNLFDAIALGTNLSLRQVVLILALLAVCSQHRRNQ